MQDVASKSTQLWALSENIEASPRRGDRNGEVRDQFDGVRAGHRKVLEGVLDFVAASKLASPPCFRAFRGQLRRWSCQLHGDGFMVTSCKVSFFMDHPFIRQHMAGADIIQATWMHGSIVREVGRLIQLLQGELEVAGGQMVQQEFPSCCFRQD